MSAARAALGSAAIAAELSRRIRGSVRADAATLALHATDASNYRHVPIAVACPEDEDDLLAAVEACRDLDLPLLPRGAGTSLAGQACNEAVILDCTRHLDRILAIDPDARTARVQPGVVLDALQRAAAPFGLRFGPDPSSHDRCTLGGMIANDACGARSLVHGRTSANVLALDVALQDGTRLLAERLGEAGLEAWRGEDSRRGALARELRALTDRHARAIGERFPRLSRRVSGYALDALLAESGVDLARALCGTEGTCAVTLSATLRLVPAPRATCLVVLGFEDIVAAADAVPALLAFRPRALEAVEATLLQATGDRARSLLPDGGAWLFVETEGESPAAARSAAEAIARATRRPAVMAPQQSQMRLLWKLREDAVGATARLATGGRTHPGWEDAAVPPERLGDYLRTFRALLARHDLAAAIYGHFGEGCVHARITFDLAAAAGIARFRAFLDEAADAVTSRGGSLSGEHGDGQARGALLERMYGAEMVEAFRAFKRAFDPRGLLNPGRVVDARPPDADLRPLALAPRATTRSADLLAAEGGLAAAALGCVGVGACRRESPGVMCPSFRATRDEALSPRGRARLLAEAEALPADRAGEFDDAIAATLRACLGCKACKTECPASVDIAAMKAAWFAAYPAAARPGLLDVMERPRRWLEAGARAPRLANLLARLPGSRAVLRALAGISPARSLPRLPRRSFFDDRRPAGSPALAGDTAAETATLFVDTFTAYLEPAIARDAVRVMEACGARVLAPETPCCGRPLFDAGRLDEARVAITRLIRALPASGDIVGLEPACVSMLRDDALRLLPGDARAADVARRTRFFAEWIAPRAERLSAILMPATTPAALVQPHCHERALAEPDAAGAALAACGWQVIPLDAGCCGMAGAFGFDSATEELSREVAEIAFAPALRSTPSLTPIVADGWSCRKQAADVAGREAHHLARLLAARLPA